MKKFKVEMIETVVTKGIIMVKATDADDAESLAREIYEAGNIVDDPRFTPTTECDEGGVDFIAR